MRSLGVVIFSLLFASCVNNDSVYKGLNLESEKLYKTIQRPSSKNVQKFKRVALVIGNNDYQEAPLTNAITDARAMRDFLKSKEFNVIYSENATEQTMRAKVDTFLYSLDDESIGFVYYSGHGIQEYSNKEKRVTNYLIPIDNSKFKRKTDLDYSAISLNYLLDVLSDKQNGLNIVMVDACRSPFKAFSKSTHNGLAPSNAKGVYIAYATADGEKALDDGLFRRSFIKYAQQPLKLIDIFEKVKVDVYNQTNQFPFISNNKRGIFYFTQPSTKKFNDKQNQESNELQMCKWLSNSTNENLSINSIIGNKILQACEKVKTTLGKGYVAKTLYQLHKYKESINVFNENKNKLEQRCNFSDTDACNLLSFYYFSIKKNYFKSIEYDEKSCNLNNSLGCTSLAWMYLKGKGVSINISKAKNLYEKSCNLNNASACNNLAYIYKDNKDYKNASKFFQKGCKLGDGNACNNLAYMYKDNKDYKGAIKFFQKGCDLGNGNSCSGLAYMYKYNKDYKNASKFFQKGCDLNNGNSCSGLALLNNQKLNRLLLLKKGCNLDDKTSCINLAREYKNNKDFDNAVIYFKKACDMGIDNACEDFAFLYLKGKNGFKKKRLEALKLLKTNCNNGDAPLCNGIARMYLLGDGVQKDFEQAFSFLKKGCTLKYNTACTNLAILYETGKGTKKDISKAKKMYIKSCNLGDKRACKILNEVKNIKEEKIYLQTSKRTVTKHFPDGFKIQGEESKTVGRTNSFYEKIGKENYERLRMDTLNIIGKHKDIGCVTYFLHTSDTLRIGISNDIKNCSNSKKQDIHLSENDDLYLVSKQRLSEIINK